MKKYDRIDKISKKFEIYYNYRCISSVFQLHDIIAENLEEFENNYYLAMEKLSNFETSLKSYFLESETDTSMKFNINKMKKYYIDKEYQLKISIGYILYRILNSYYIEPNDFIDVDLYYIYSVGELSKDFKEKIDNMLIRFEKIDKQQYLIIEFENKENKERFKHCYIDIIHSV